MEEDIFIRFAIEPGAEELVNVKLNTMTTKDGEVILHANLTIRAGSEDKTSTFYSPVGNIYGIGAEFRRMSQAVIRLQQISARFGVKFFEDHPAQLGADYLEFIYSSKFKKYLIGQLATKGEELRSGPAQWIEFGAIARTLDMTDDREILVFNSVANRAYEGMDRFKTKIINALGHALSPYVLKKEAL